MIKRIVGDIDRAHELVAEVLWVVGGHTGPVLRWLDAPAVCFAALLGAVLGNL